jgi:hypothetical protein
MTDIPDTPEDIPPKVEMGGAVGRTASLACRQGQHDLCPEGGEQDPCNCRCHGRFWYDRPLHPSEQS